MARRHYSFKKRTSLFRSHCKLAVTSFVLFQFVLISPSTGRSDTMTIKSCEPIFFSKAEVSVKSKSLSLNNGSRIIAQPDLIWLKNQMNASQIKMEKNLSPKEGLPGSITAATTPVYQFHWVRDAAITMMTYLREHISNPWGPMDEYLSFSNRIQGLKTLAGLGEPKFYLNGTAYNLPWGRPQSDSPAYRALSFIEYANLLILKNQRAMVIKKLYDPQAMSSTIKVDLEYVAHHWQEASADLWEEIHGLNFHTLAVQRKALYEGAKLAKSLGDEGAANYYFAQSKIIKKRMQDFYKPKRQEIMGEYYLATLPESIPAENPMDYKTSLLDSSIVFGFVHGYVEEEAITANGFGEFAYNSPKVIASVETLVETFEKFYPINKNKNIPGVAIGRYTEDVYIDGNPWFISTAIVGQYYYERGIEWLKAYPEQITEAKLLFEKGNQFLERIHYHANPDGSMREQFDKNNGYQNSVDDLTWSHAGLLDLADARKRLVDLIESNSPHN